METQRKEHKQKNLFTIFSQGWVIAVKITTINIALQSQPSYHLKDLIANLQELKVCVYLFICDNIVGLN